MKKVWIFLFTALFIIIVFSLHLEGVAFVLMVLGEMLEVFRAIPKDETKNLEEKVKNRQESIDTLNEKIDELLKNQEELLSFKERYNELYKNEVLDNSKA